MYVVVRIHFAGYSRALKPQLMTLHYLAMMCKSKKNNRKQKQDHNNKTIQMKQNP